MMVFSFHGSFRFDFWSSYTHGNHLHARETPFPMLSQKDPTTKLIPLHNAGFLQHVFSEKKGFLQSATAVKRCYTAAKPTHCEA